MGCGSSTASRSQVKPCIMLSSEKMIENRDISKAVAAGFQIHVLSSLCIQPRLTSVKISPMKLIDAKDSSTIKIPTKSTVLPIDESSIANISLAYVGQHFEKESIHLKDDVHLPIGNETKQCDPNSISQPLGFPGILDMHLISECDSKQEASLLQNDYQKILATSSCKPSQFSILEISPVYANKRTSIHSHVADMEKMANPVISFTGYMSNQEILQKTWQEYDTKIIERLKTYVYSGNFDMLPNSRLNFNN